MEESSIKTTRWIARILGGLAVIFFGMFFIGEGIPDLFNDETGQLQSMMLLLGFAIMGYIFSWKREKEGGIVMSVSGVLMGLYLLYQGGFKDSVAMLVYALPFLIPGLMFLWLGYNKDKQN
jgi:hypothetical protein